MLFPFASLERGFVTLPALPSHVLAWLPVRPAVFEQRQTGYMSNWKSGIGEIYVLEQVGCFLGKSWVFPGRAEIPASRRSKDTSSWGLHRSYLMVYQEREALRGNPSSVVRTPTNHWESRGGMKPCDGPTASGQRGHSGWPCLTITAEVFATLSQLDFLWRAFWDCSGSCEIWTLESSHTFLFVLCRPDYCEKC